MQNVYPENIVFLISLTMINFHFVRTQGHHVQTLFEVRARRQQTTPDVITARLRA